MQHKLTLLQLLALVLLTVSLVTAKRVKSADYVTKPGRIVGGSIAEKGSAPYQVSLQNFWGHFCGGAIIATKWIVSAGHCVVNKYPEDISVLTGTQDLDDFTGTHYYVDRIYVHCNFDNPVSGNDISLLHLNESIVLNSKSQIISLPTKPMKDGDEVILTGWGTEEYLGDSPHLLKMVVLKNLEYKQCKEAHQKLTRTIVDVGQVCTFTKSGEGSCHSDSGSPLVSNGTLVGIVCWGVPCAVGYPDLYTSTYFYLDWIRTIMSGNCRHRKKFFTN